MQIEQDPGSYRVQKPDGTWTQRVNRPLCRVIGIAGMALAAWMAWLFIAEGGTAQDAVMFTVLGFASGSLITLSLRSID